MSYPSGELELRQIGANGRELKNNHSQPSFRRRSHPVYKALDAVATTPLREDRGIWRQALDPRLSNYDRVAALVGLCDRLAPGVARRWSQRLFGNAALPLAGASHTLYAYGSGATVFRIQGGALAQPGLVLKVYRRTLGRDGHRLLQLAHFLRGKYETVSRWYQGAGIYVAPSFYFIFNAPLLGAPAVGMVQPFVEQEMNDLFEDYTQETLLRLLAQDTALAGQLRFFCRRTLEIIAQEGRCLDFVGRDNVCVLQGGQKQSQLAIVDFGIFDLKEKRAQAPVAYDEVMSRVQRLEALLRAAGGTMSEEMATGHGSQQE